MRQPQATGKLGCMKSLLRWHRTYPRRQVGSRPYGSTPKVACLPSGCKPVIIATVIQALGKLGKRRCVGLIGTEDDYAVRDVILHGRTIGPAIRIDGA